MPDRQLELRRLAAEKNTVSETVKLGYRLQVCCLVCHRKVLVDVRNLERQGYGERTLKDLADKFRCTPCARSRRKVSIHPAGKDVFIRVLFVGEKE